MKAGAVAVPVNTLLKERDYQYLLADSGAVALIVSEALLSLVERIPRAELRRLRHSSSWAPVSTHSSLRFDDLLASGSPALEAEPTTRDDPAFWMYSSGSTGTPKGCVHLHHDMVVCAELFAKGILGITAADRCFSVAKLFFAYGLGNALYFPLAVGATSILWPGPPAAANVYEVIERHRPTLFFSVPTGYAMLLAHTPRARVRSLEHPCCRVGGRSAAPGALRAIQRAVRARDSSTASARPRRCTCSSPIAPARSAPARAARSCPATRRGFSTARASPCPHGEIGNLWIRGDSVCACYWNQHEKTQDTIQGAWLRTGDKYILRRRRLLLVRRALRRHAEGRRPVGQPGRSRERRADASRPYRSAASSATKIATAWSSRWRLSSLRAGTEGSAERAGELEQFVRARLAEFKRPRRVSVRFRVAEDRHGQDSALQAARALSDQLSAIS